MEDKAFEKKHGKDASQLKKHLAKTPGTCTFNDAVQGIIKLRSLHVEMDNAVLEAYGWQDILLRHDFYDVDYLPENDRTRYTIHPDARKEVLKRLLELNHKIYEEEVKAGLWEKKSGKKEKAKNRDNGVKKKDYPRYVTRVYGKNYLKFNQIKGFLPTKVIASVFSIHGEWPMPQEIKNTRSKIVDINDLRLVYGYNSYDLTSIANGIARFVEILYTDNQRLDALLTHLNLEYAGKLKTQPQNVQNPVWRVANEDNWQEVLGEFKYKRVELKDIMFRRLGREIWLDNMSSGEKMLMIRILTLLSSIDNNSIVFIEEPELHLDEIWKRQLISILDALFSIYNSHFVIATHSGSLLNTVGKQHIIFLEEGKQRHIDFNTFLVDEEVLFQHLYSGELTLNSMEQAVLDKIKASQSQRTIKAIHDSVGDSVFKLLSLNKMNLLNEKSSAKRKS